MKTYWVYILASHKRVLYVGMTSNIAKRMYEHRHKPTGGFTARYNVNQLVYFEQTNQVEEAIRREKQIKGWRREKKLELIRTFNPHWRDFSQLFLSEQPKPG
ncbi:MAG: GIY-YIG nuclease family protein [Meiothermus sp.]|uniref:GIY-YIG nuclease family protein n=1 Tax=Meiothermus sp. TaxID=1955249 RepID=UPI0025CDE87A|nr:GIY-YIG nuclease family protein [Meiothermus sp.]MCS7067522.1 GIY-YIG nuclease family protein [Meiothermus sp.]MDW8426832.1 GIY-YIG nuclease family protein [Meiothermus sp.]